MPATAKLPDNLETLRTPTREKEYRVKHIFRTIQGEGYWSGTAAVFVRFVGCNMWSGYEKDRERDAERNDADCPLWCDTDFTPEGSTTYTANDLVSAIEDEAGPVAHVVCTGGEPLLQLDSTLVGRMQDAGFYVHVETNGTVPIEQAFVRVEPNWITCSPKHPVGRVCLRRMNELKLVVPDYHPDEYKSLVPRIAPANMGGVGRRPRYVQPEDGPRQKEATEMAIEIVRSRPRWHISVQTHKVLDIA